MRQHFHHKTPRYALRDKRHFLRLIQHHRSWSVNARLDFTDDHLQVFEVAFRSNARQFEVGNNPSSILQKSLVLLHYLSLEWEAMTVKIDLVLSKNVKSQRSRTFVHHQFSCLIQKFWDTSEASIHQHMSNRNSWANRTNMPCTGNNHWDLYKRVSCERAPRETIFAQQYPDGRVSCF